MGSEEDALCEATPKGSYNYDIKTGVNSTKSPLSYFYLFLFLFYELFPVNLSDYFKSHIKIYPLIAPAIIWEGSFGLNVKHVISNVDIKTITFIFFIFLFFFNIL